MKKAGPKTIHFPSNDELSIFDAAMRYKQEDVTAIILAGKEYGSGSSRDWAAKGPWMQGVRAVLAESYERIHRSIQVRVRFDTDVELTYFNHGGILNYMIRSML